MSETKIDEDELFGLFGLTASKNSLASASTAASSSKKPAPARVLPDKRYNALAILSKKLPDKFETLSKAIMNFDESAIERSMVRELMSNVPALEEEQALRDAVAAGANLDKVELFASRMMDIAFVRTRLRCWSFMIEFDERLTDIGPPILTVQKACKELLDSRSVRELLMSVLSIGNYVNGGNTTRGQADGFALDIMEKLYDIKDSNNSGSLFDLAVRYVHNRSLPEDLANVPAAAGVEFKTIQANFNKLAKELDEVKTYCQEVLASGPSPKDPFCSVMPRFVQQAETKLVNMRAEVVHTEQLFLGTVDYFTGSREGSLQHTTESFFGLWGRVIANFRKSSQATVNQPKSRGAGEKLGDGDDPIADVIAHIKSGKVKKTSPAQAKQTVTVAAEMIAAAASSLKPTK